MSANISPRLRQLAQTLPPEESLRLHVLLRRDLPAGAVERAADQIRQLAAPSPGVEVLPRSGIILCSAPATKVGVIAALPDVAWVDRDSEAPLESLLDR
jgi:hypothetical protein